MKKCDRIVSGDNKFFIFAAAFRKEAKLIDLWCNGNTSDFGSE
jgi:hypothetical protein